MGKQMPPTLICIVPNPSIDRTAEVDVLQPGSIHRPAAVVAVPGGKGLNVARAAQTLGAPVRAVAVLAGHAGHWIDEELDRLEIPHAAAWAAGETRTCLSILDRSSGAMTEFYESGAHVGADDWRAFERLVGTEVDDAAPGSIGVLSGSLPPGVDGGAAAGIVRACREAGLAVLVDTSGSSLEAALGAGPDVVKVNAGEVGALLDREVSTEDDAVAAARSVVERGARVGIVTRGNRGAVAWDGERGWVVQPPSSDGRHVVGSGDAFLAGLAVAMLRAEQLESCLRLAAAAAAASTQVAGPGKLDPDVADRLCRAVVVSPSR
jgi:1-phosphofructokinase family hexose kinase